MKKQILRPIVQRGYSLRPIALALATAGLLSLAHAAPQDGIVRAGDARISGGGAYTRIDQNTQRAVIDWRAFSTGAGEQVQFVQPSASSAILNRVTGSQMSTLLGKLDANGQVLLINPNGIVIGKGGQINVGSFIASTSNISNTNFMAGRLVFDQPGKPGAGILNAGSITAAEGGLVALVAPHVRNDGLIQARLGRVMLGAADTFTIDLYGDQLVNLALSDANIGQLMDAYGQPVQSLITQAGRIEAGQAVLITAATARNVLDNLINMSGTIKAETAAQDGGRIVLLGEGGKVNVSGTLDASGNRGGQIEVLGQDVALASTASLNANGASGGGAIHVGGDYQGGGSTYRAQSTTVASGASLTANAITNGNGGEVVVWSDGATTFAGDVQAKGGALGGNGGRMEVSGKGTLAFNGTADASAANGVSGSLLLDPAYLDIGLSEAGLIRRVLRTGTSVTLQADVDINVNAVIDGRGYLAGGGLAMTAGNNININDFIVTNNGAINLFAGAGTVNIASGKAVFAGAAPITVSAGGNLSTGPFLTGGALSLTSRGGSVAVNSFIDSGTGPVTISAATDVDINQPITSLANGNPLNVRAGNDIRVNAQIDGRNGTAEGGAVTLTAGKDLKLFDHIITNNGAINLTTITGSVFLAPVAQDANLLILATPKQVRAGNAPITIVSGLDFSTGASPPQPIPPPTNGETDGDAYVREFLKQYVQLVTTGALNITSTNGNVNVIAPISDMTGPVTITAGNAINVKHKINSNNQPIELNAGPGGLKVFFVDTDCSICDLEHRPPVDARDANLTLNSVGNVTIIGEGVATSKTLTINTRGQIVSGSIGDSKGSASRPSQVILIADGGIQNFGVGTAGDVSATSIGGSINLGVEFPGKLRITTGTPDPNNPTAATDCTTCNISTGGFIGPDVVLNAGGSINLSGSSGKVLSLIARGDGIGIVGGDVNLGGLLLGDFGGGQLTVNAGRDVNMSDLIWVGPKPGFSAASGPLSITAGRDIVTTANSPIHVSNNQPLTLSAGSNVTLNLLETLGPVSITATTGNITLNNDIGPHIVNNTGDPDFNPNDKGVAALTMSAPAVTAAINMQGARAEGDVTISTGGSLTAAKQITSVSGTVSITAGSQSIANVAIGSQDQLALSPLVLPAIPPGPTVPPPAAPALVIEPPPGQLPFTEILPLTANAQRAAEQCSTAEEAAGGDAAIVTLASSDSKAAGQQAGPPGVAPGSAVRTKDASGLIATAACK